MYGGDPHLPISMEQSTQMRILFVGDIVAEAGLAHLERTLPGLKGSESPDLVIVNGENAYEGKGIRPSDANRILDAGADVITTGNHIWEKWQSKKVLAERANVLRPDNYPPGNVGSGTYRFPVAGRDVLVVNLQGRTFLPEIDCPFRAIDRILERVNRSTVVLIDFHGEATAEKIAFGRYVDGRASLVVGTHTHVPTSDAQIFPGGTAYLTDLGMTGPFDSVIGMKIEPAVNRFVYRTPFKYESATDDPRLCGVIVELEGETIKARSIRHIISPPFFSGPVENTQGSAVSEPEISRDQRED
jgi:hypothetical protein